MQSLVSRIASKLAFFPPTPPSYSVKMHDDGTGEEYIQPSMPCVFLISRVLECTYWAESAQACAFVA